jgi:hypothetical protein
MKRIAGQELRVNGISIDDRSVTFGGSDEVEADARGDGWTPRIVDRDG